VLTPVVTRCDFRSQFDPKNCDVGPRWGAYSTPGPLAGLRARERSGGVREEEEEGRGGKRKGGRGGEGKETLCPSFNS